MRIAYVCADVGIPVFGTKGASIHVQEIVRQFIARGFQVSLFAAKLGGPVPAEFDGIDIVDFGSEHQDRKNEDTSPENREAKAQQIADAIFSEMVRRGGFDLVYERYSLWSAAGCKYAKANGVACISEVNAPLIPEQQQHRQLVNAVVARQIEHQVFSDSTSVISVSAEVAAYIQAVVGTNVPVTVVPNGVNLSRFVNLSQADCEERPTLTIGFVGTLKPWHGVDLLIRAFAELHRRYPNARLMLVGDGPMRGSLVSLSHELAIHNAIDWVGNVDAAHVPQWLAKFDIAVAPYPNLQDFYFSPLKLFEYMASGVPVVASRIGQIAEVIEDRFDGFLVDAGDITQLKVAIETLIDSRDLRRFIGRNGREKAIQHFGWDNVMERILATVGRSCSNDGISEVNEYVRSPG